MKTAVVILPGRGTYNKGELGVLQRQFPDPDLLATFDSYRAQHDQETLSALDSSDRFSAARHLRGENASALIYAASFGDVLSLNGEKIEVVAVTGNSMGWYTTLACAGALDPLQGFDVVHSTGAWMGESGTGGQLVYPHVGPDWIAAPDRKSELLSLVETINAVEGQTVSLSIDLGGNLVLAGDDAGLRAFEERVAKQDRFPMRLPGHVGFHSPLVSAVSERAMSHFEPHMFAQPKYPMVDGRGHIWWPGASDPDALKAYTFGHQIVAPYDFTHAIKIAAQEFAPDMFIVTGPGTTLGGAVAQSLIQVRWQGFESKEDFVERQGTDPVLISMGIDTQRALVV